MKEKINEIKFLIQSKRFLYKSKIFKLEEVKKKE